MPDAHLPPAHAWWILTHLGASSLLLPALLLVLGGLWESGARDAAKRYLLRLSIAVGITVVSKCLFFGWGIGIAALDFTGVSGHTLLATSILPVLLRGIPWPALQARGGGAVLGGLLVQKASWRWIFGIMATMAVLVTAVASAQSSLETVMAVRDQVIAAYQEIMRMPI